MKINTKVLLRQSTWLWLLFGISTLYLISFLAWLVLVSLNNGTHMSTFAANGTFQLYNPMRRLALGQTIGYDFPFFHGIGIPLLHYPLFLSLGGGVFAAETAKWVVSPILFLSSSLFFFYAYFRSFKKSIISVALLTIISLSWVDVIWPGNSLIGARGTFPILAISALLWKTARIIKIKTVTIPANEFVALILLGLSLPFGTEQGVAAILAYALVSFVIIFRRQRKTWIVNIFHLALRGLFILFVAFVTYSVLTKGHPLSAIRYAFIDIPQDQGWYFGTDIAGYLTIFNFLPTLFHSSMRYVWMIMVGGGISLFITFRILKQKRMLLPLWFAFTYGTVAFVISISGYYSPITQLIPLERIMSLILIATVVSFSFSNRVWNWQTAQTKQRHLKITILVAALLILLCALTSITYVKIATIKNDFSVREDLKLAAEARNSNDYFAASAGWKQSLDAFRPYIDPSKTMWSMYTSVYDTTFGNHINASSGGEDYIIHALGDESRAAYQNDFLTTKPHYVLTLKPSYFDFEEWLWHSHWPIYKEIFTNYNLVAENASNYLWERKPDPQKQTRPAFPIKTTATGFSLPANRTNRPAIYSVDINYTARTAIPLTSRLPRYFIKINTHYEAQKYRISLPSHKTTWSFPVIVMPGEDTIELEAFTDGIIPADLTINSASYTQISIENNNLKPIENNICFINSKNISYNSRPWSCDSTTYNITYK